MLKMLRSVRNTSGWARIDSSTITPTSNSTPNRSSSSVARIQPERPEDDASSSPWAVGLATSATIEPARDRHRARVPLVGGPVAHDPADDIVAAHVRERRLGEVPAVEQGHHPVANIEHVVQAMADEDHADAVRAEVLDQVQD